jgi:hypothetical protein
MAMYDDILKQMQSSFTGMSPQRMGQPGGFMQPTFNFKDDIIKGGGVGTGGGPDDGDDGDVGGGSGSGGSSGGGSPSYGPTTYGGQYGSQFSSIEDILEGIGQSGYSLLNPAAQYGYGGDYSEYFGQFDISGYNQAQQALRERESRLLGEIGNQFQRGTEGIQSGLQDALLGMIGRESVAGLVGGRQLERRRMTRAGGQEQLEQLGQTTRSRYAGTQEQIGQQMGLLEGTLLDFIASQAGVALNLMQAGATKTGDGSQNTGWKAQPKGTPMTAGQLSEYQGMFGDLSNGIQAFNQFVSLAHSNLNSSQLSQLANAIYAQYQQADESGGT